MRIMGYSAEWPKLKQDTFTSFRFERRDKDWAINETAQIKVKPRSKGGGKYLGNAIIIRKESVDGLHFITDAEAVEDGFESKVAMWRWLLRSHTPEQLVRPLNKLTLRWIKV